jgi:hypothetical protein
MFKLVQAYHLFGVMKVRASSTGESSVKPSVGHRV